MPITIEPVSERHVAGFRQVLDTVARERKYLARAEAPPLDAVRAFAENNIAKGNPQFIAVNEEGIVAGWCDIVRFENPLSRHAGVLGMGVAPSARGQGIGAQLIKRTLQDAWERKFVRVELTVYATNTVAIRLYEKFGFVTEGEMIDAVCIDGVYGNSIMMGLVKH